jgi:hypothetical protein
MRIWITFLLLLAAYTGAAQTDSSIIRRIYLIGDAGNDTAPGPALHMLHKMAEADDSATVVFLGDNVYPRGTDGKTSSVQKLMTQLRAVDSAGQVIVVPGNHDWLAQARGGWKALEVQRFLVDSALAATHNGRANGNLFPKTIGPGPAVVEIDSSLIIVIWDSQWWLQGYPFHTLPKHQRYRAKEIYNAALQQLDSILNVADKHNQRVLFCLHHPLYSNGVHGNPKLGVAASLITYTPLQVFGLMGLNRLFSQQAAHPRYKKQRHDLLGIINRYDSIIIAAGHDHNLQAIKDSTSGNVHIVSGAGSKKSAIRKEVYPVVYSNDSQPGFFIIEVMANGRLKLISCLADGSKVIITTDF